MSYDVKCCICGSVIHVNEDFSASDFEVVESEEKGMGTENTHEASMVVQCKKCSNDITVTVDFYEYPVGNFDCQNKEVTADGGILVIEPNLNNCIDDLIAKSLGA